MKKMKKFILTSLLSCLVLLTAYGQEASPGQGVRDNKIRLGVSPVPHGEIIEILEPRFEKTGLDVEVAIFDDYVMPNLVLDQGDLDVNLFQHVPYLDDLVREGGVKSANPGVVHLKSTGLYSDKYKSVDGLEDGDEILVPNGATNGSRASTLSEKAGVIKLNDPGNLAITEEDITEDSKNLKFTALDALSIPRSYKEVAGAVINSSYALGAGLDPTKDSLLTENKGFLYANTITVRQEEEGQEKFKKFMEVPHSEACRKLIEEIYKGAVVPAF